MILNDMQSELAVSKITIAAHHIDLLFTSPLDKIENIGGKRITTELFATINALVGEMNPDESFFELI